MSWTISDELAARFFFEVCTEFDHVRLQKSIKSRSGGASMYIDNYIYIVTHGWLFVGDLVARVSFS